MGVLVIIIGSLSVAYYYKQQSEQKIITSDVSSSTPSSEIGSQTPSTKPTSTGSVSTQTVQGDKQPAQTSKQLYLITKNSSGNYVLSRKITISNNSYTFQKIDGYDLLRFSDHAQDFTVSSDGGKPDLPVYQFKIRLPLDTKIQNVKVNFGQKIFIGKLNLPIVNPQPNCMGCQTGPAYSPHPLNGMVPESAFGYELKKIDGYSQALFVYVYPITFDNSNGDTYTYSGFQINAEYTTTNQVIIDKIQPEQLSSFDTGKNITVSASVTNMTSEPVTIQSQVGLFEVNGINNKVASNQTSKTIPGNAEEIILTMLQAPSDTYSRQIDDYEIKVDFSSAKNKLFSDSIPIRIKPSVYVKINCFNYPQTVHYRDIAKYELCIKNNSSQKIRTYIDIYINNGPTTAVKLVQSYVDIDPGQTKNPTITWIPNYTDMQTGQYNVQAVVSTDKFKTTETKFFQYNSEAVN